MAGKIVASTINDDTGVLATQNGMTGIPKAWIQFTYIGGTLTTTGSFNVSSFTRSGTGQYTLNFTTAMPNANYSAVTSGSLSTAATWCVGTSFTNTGAPYYTAPTASSCVFVWISIGGSLTDPAYGNIAILSS
jgi:hypothetical protein